MDLRGLEMPDGLSTIVNKTTGATSMWYQPYVFRDDLMTGAAAGWMHQATSNVADDSDPPHVRETFLRATMQMARWYERVVDAVVASFPEAGTFLDIGCNSGYVGFILTARGATYTGVDTWASAYKLISSITGIAFEYAHGRYESSAHSIPLLGARRFGVVIAMAVMPHLTDPHYFLAHIASRAKHGVVVTTPVAGSSRPTFEARLPSWRSHAGLPDSLEFLPSVSMVELLLLLAGFPYVRRLPFSHTTDPPSTSTWGTWIASRTPFPARAAIITEPVSTTIARFADMRVGARSVRPHLPWPHQR